LVSVGSLLAFGLLWLFGLSLVVLQFTAGTRRRTGLRWQGPGWLLSGLRWQSIGLLLLYSVMLVTDFVQYRDWPSSRLQTVHSITSPILLVALVLIGIGTVFSLRNRRKARQAESPAE